MSWLDALRDRGLQATRGLQPEPPIVRKPAVEPEIKSLWVQTVAPREGDPGAVEPGFYSVTGGVVTMHDEQGRPTGNTHRLRPGDDPRQIAHVMTREARLKSRDESNFNRPLNYQPSTKE
jgi:hypothetical protein